MLLLNVIVLLARGIVCAPEVTPEADYQSLGLNDNGDSLIIPTTSGTRELVQPVCSDCFGSNTPI